MGTRWVCSWEDLRSPQEQRAWTWRPPLDKAEGSSLRARPAREAPSPEPVPRKENQEGDNQEGQHRRVVHDVSEVAASGRDRQPYNEADDGEADAGGRYQPAPPGCAPHSYDTNNEYRANHRLGDSRGTGLERP